MPSVLSLFLALLPVALAVPTVNKVQTANTVQGKWIAELNDNVAIESVMNTIKAVTGIKTKHEYSTDSWKGFSFEGSEAVVDILSTFGFLKSVEPDTKVTIQAPVSSPNPSIQVKRALTTQSGAIYGLARISHRSKGQSGYIYDSGAGSGSYIYVIDTGINSAHQAFGGRAIQGANFVDGESIADGNGHGTHCSGTTASSTYGVAKKATVIGVKVLDSQGSGYNSDILAGINWVINDAKSRGGVGRSVISMSLGGGYSDQTNSAVRSATNAGIFAAVAAGNENQDAGNTSPASESSACTVGAIDSNDNRASFSNYGSFLDIFAPGVNILSTWIGSTTATNTISGTSMATPHIAGLAAYLIALEGPRSPSALCQRIQSLSTKNQIPNPNGSVNYIAYNGNGA
ncbi:related to Cuticle-degrading protease [Ramularia collo-cygni]|uniref:Related to Cuticle-degrading protease n=1 Tax=Ramularia collo-cygni TaxID=112498 RepID=A0A2D3VF68_9PEZI|nr:related to Cuticle-degrading protease [Ramularia collo-cygni]CZT20419.1 related to Cuticle-degrading protease [Ramularia collo-cygni]